MKASALGSAGTVGLLVVVAAWGLSAQSSSFEVASIHPLAPPFHALRSLKISGTLITLEAYNVSWLVSEAFGVKDYQVSSDSVPRPALEAFYRIEARVGGQSAPRKVDIRIMLQSLLADRFHLATHRETRKMPVYALVLDKKGPVLKPASGGSECSTHIGPVRPGDRKYRYQYANCTIETLIDALSADRPILDRTGLNARYDMEVSATPEFMMRDTAEPGDIRFLDAVRKLGLRLEAESASVEVVVIDHVDSSPSAN